MRLLITDTLAVTWAVSGAQLIWINAVASRLAVDGRPAFAMNYAAISILLSAAWVAVLHLNGSRDHRVIGTQSTEYRRVVTASLALFGAVAVVAYLLRTDLGRGYLITALPLGLGMLLTSRWMWRRWLERKRKAGDFAYRVVVVGSEECVTHLAEELARAPAAGYRVVGAVIPGAAQGLRLAGKSLPSASDLAEVLPLVDQTGADTVAIASSDDLPPERVRELSWSLEPGRQHLVVAPSLTDIAGPRLHTRPVAGLPLIHVETPRYEGRKLYLKRAFDLVVSSALLVIIAPVLLAIALAVALSSPGPVFFSQPRIGKDGREFRMLKFRSMVVDAEARLAALQAQQRDRGNAVLFKMSNDPRVTPIGRILRRYSLDELPQLLNVWRGEMSLVGPRPPLPREVAQYERKVTRRFLVKPGITGLWQVSGRSDLSWEESVRLDLYYVENWSMTGDLVILLRTARAVLGSSGAY